MKKYIGFFVLIFIGISSFAQIQRKSSAANNQSSPAILDEKITDDNKESKRTRFKDLNLTKEQKVALREIQQSAKAKKELIINDATLSKDEKNKKLKALKINTALSLSKILTPEQIDQMKKNRKENKKGGGLDNMENK